MLVYLLIYTFLAQLETEQERVQLQLNGLWIEHTITSCNCTLYRMIYTKCVYAVHKQHAFNMDFYSLPHIEHERQISRHNRVTFASKAKTKRQIRALLRVRLALVWRALSVAAVFLARAEQTECGFCPLQLWADVWPLFHAKLANFPSKETKSHGLWKRQYGQDMCRQLCPIHVSAVCVCVRAQMCQKSAICQMALVH